jgi:very-short-patch-repair endonuclease
LNKEITEYDNGRSHDIKKCGIKILRFTNNEVYTDMKTIIDQILKTITDLEPPLGGQGVKARE